MSRSTHQQPSQESSADCNDHDDEYQLIPDSPNESDIDIDDHEYLGSREVLPHTESSVEKPSKRKICISVLVLIIGIGVIGILLVLFIAPYFGLVKVPDEPTILNAYSRVDTCVLLTSFTCGLNCEITEIDVEMNPYNNQSQVEISLLGPNLLLVSHQPPASIFLGSILSHY